MSSPSPVTDGTHVWVMTGTGMLKAFDFAGKELWTRDIQKDYGRVRPALGLRVVAAAARGRALRAGAARHEDRRSVVRAAHRQGDRQDGLARRAADQRALRIAGRVHDAGAAALRRQDRDRHHRRRRRHRPRSRRPGKELWRADGLNPRQRRQLPHRRVAGRARRADHRAVARAAAAGAQGRAGAATSPTSHVLWSFDSGPDVPTPVTDGTYLYVVNDRGIMYCLDAKTGQAGLRAAAPAATTPTAARRCWPTARSTSPTRDGVTSVFRAGPKFELLASNTFGDPCTPYCLASVAVSEGRAVRQNGRQPVGGWDSGGSRNAQPGGCAVARFITSLTLILAFLPAGAAEHRVPTIDDLLTLKSIGARRFRPMAPASSTPRPKRTSSRTPS